ncbi:MAG: hypothetical protein A2Y24_04140 [Clostridiales bacterium GWE2_32_10]|nr:MAG: hypothetical protein A2Y24_04140 [Clostridiales bacterium GWE2_32_10]HBY21691.1 hypothetical protein [Clostridiales bacterium]
MFKTYSYILNENIAGYGSGERKPSGYCKIKCLDDKDTVDLNVRNIETANNKYNCYLIYFKDKYYGVHIGEASVLGENNIILKKEIEDKDKINTDELTGFAITNEAEDDRAILYGYNDEENLWDGFFVKTYKEENEEGSEENIRDLDCEVDYKENTMLDSIVIENITTEEEQIEFNEEEYRKIHMDDLIHMDKFKWSIYNNILMYISYKKYGFVLYKDDLDNSTIAIPIEENYIRAVRDRYTYIKAKNKNYDGYIILEW